MDRSLNVSPYHYTHDNPISRIDIDGQDDWNYLFAVTERENRLNLLSNTNRQREIDIGAKVMARDFDKTSTMLTALSIKSPTPIKPYILGTAITLKSLAILSKIYLMSAKSENWTFDILGDAAGFLISKKYGALAGEGIDFILDLPGEYPSEEKTDKRFNCHSTLQNSNTKSMLKSVDRDKWGSGKSPREMWDEMNGTDEDDKDQ